ncbi:hypothetical protein EFW17_00745 [Halostreptopolyspora alba]|uniref:Lanthionine synthetase n=2 Tax=Halostreptopolyspora alba TaxID=2487137 RepID=A0A3N0EIE1_9ACTN|nr:hypothetical protein EFW17_00745 [Nocardiopsaceae bacterium YIM 96095]
MNGQTPYNRALNKLHTGHEYTYDTERLIIQKALRGPIRDTGAPPSMNGVSDDKKELDRFLFREADRYAEDCMDRHVTVGTENPLFIGASHCPITGNTTVAPITTGLYSGISGLLLMYAGCYRVLGDNKFLTGATQTLDTLSYIDRNPKPDIWFGFTGATSDIYALSIASRILPENMGTELQSAYSKHLIRSIHWLTRVTRPDVVGGLSGTLLACVAIAENGVCDLTDQLIEDIYFRISRPWVPTEKTNLDLGQLGMAHGTVGVYFAAARAAKYLGYTSDFTVWVEKLHEAGWTLLRTAQRSADYGSVSWCRGTAGLAAILVYLDRRSGEVHPLTTATLQWLFDNSSLAEGRCLCCGVGSLVDLLASLSSNSGTTNRIPTMDWTKLIKRWIAQPQNPRIPTDANYLGSMQGTSGFVYVLLRLTSRGDDLPSLLTLDSF